MNLNYIFPTPVWQDTLSCDLYAMKKYIFSLQDQQQGRVVSNLHGWQSESYLPENLMQTPICQFISVLEKKIKVCASDYGSSKQPVISNLWFNVNPSGASNSTHVHTDSFLSGVFYVQAPDNCGDIVFERQAHEQYILGSHIRNSTIIPSAAQWKFKPKHNLLLIFPAWTPHHVEINNSESKRISISFNILQV